MITFSHFLTNASSNTKCQEKYENFCTLFRIMLFCCTCKASVCKRWWETKNSEEQNLSIG